MAQMDVEGRAADLGAVKAQGRQAQIFGQHHRPEAHLAGGAENAVDVRQLQSALGQGPMRGLGHQVRRGRVGRDLAKVGFGGGDHGHRAARDRVQDAAPSARRNTGRGSAPSRSSISACTFWPMRTLSGSTPITVLIRRKPSSISTSTTL